MANRRQLKKSIDLICSELIANCTVLNMCGINDREKTESLLKKILDVHVEYISRISHTQKGQERLFYKKLREGFTQEIDAINKEINE